MRIGKHGRALVAAAALALWAAGAGAREPDYADEIERFVNRACLHGILRAQGGLPGVPADEAVDLLRIVGRDQWDKTYGTVLPMVEGRPTEDCMTLYRTLAEHCVRSGTAGSGR